MAEGSALFTEILDVIRKHYYMGQPWHYIIAALYVMEAWVAEGLPSVFYLFIGGPKGTGKTSFLDRVSELTDALRFQEVSLSAMARVMKKGRAVTMDEYDAGGDRDFLELRDAFVRNGYKSNAPPYTRYNPTMHKNDEVEVFGPRLISFRGGLDEALQDRGFYIPSVKAEGEHAYDYVRRNFWPEIGDLPTRGKEWGTAALKAFPRERLRDLTWTPEFERKVKDVLGTVPGGRDAELMTIALLVAEMAEVDVLKELKDANELREMETFASSDPAHDLLREVIHEKAYDLGITVTGTSDVALGKQEDYRVALNARLKSAGDRPASNRRFKQLLRDIGFKEGWRRERHHTIYWVVPLNDLKILLGLGSAATSPPSSPPDGPSGVPTDMGDAAQGDRGTRGSPEAGRRRPSHFPPVPPGPPVPLRQI